MQRPNHNFQRNEQQSRGSQHNHLYIPPQQRSGFYYLCNYISKPEVSDSKVLHNVILRKLAYIA